MEIKFKMTQRDWQEGYRVGLSHMRLPYLLLWIGISLLLLVGSMLILYGKGFPTTWTAANLPQRLALIYSVMHLAAALVVGVSPSILLNYLYPLHTIQLWSGCLAQKQLGVVSRIRWKNVTDIIETSQHVLFCRNHIMAVIIPKSAFTNKEQADAFLEQATHHWREAKEIPAPPVPDTAGVWPPAPLPSNSAEPGDSR